MLSSTLLENLSRVKVVSVVASQSHAPLVTLLSSLLPCKVELSCFMGSYQNYHVRVGDTLVKITDNCPVNKKIYSVGDQCFISFDPACAHLL